MERVSKLIAPVRMPIIDWLPNYDKSLFTRDLVAGMTVFVFLIPQGMAYAILAGYPAVYGLYSATVPLLVYACFSTSKHLSIGPMAITSLLLGSTCQRFGFEEGTDEYISVAATASFLVGFITICLGLFRMGNLAGIISNSVLIGFVTATAVVIALAQLKYILGIKVPRFTYSHETIIYIASHIQETNWRALLIGVCTCASLYALKEWKRRNKTPSESCSPTAHRAMLLLTNLSNLLAILIGAVVAWAIVSSGAPLQIVGDVPSGLKMPSFPLASFPVFLSLIPSCVALAFVTFANNWAIATNYAIRFNYEIDATQELIASGLATMVGVVFNCFITGGGLARSSVNVESGAATQLSTIITACLIFISLFLFTTYFYYIPMAVLAAIIEVSVVSMADFTSMKKAYYVDKRDCFVMVGTFLATFFIGVTDGLFVGILLSFAVVMKNAAFPQMVHLGQLPEEEGGHFKDIARFPEAQQLPGVAIIRMDASLFFGNCAHFKAVAKQAASGLFHSSSDRIQMVIFDASAWIDVDMEGLKTLTELKAELLKMGEVQLRIACAKGVVRDILRSSEHGPVFNTILYMSIQDAVAGKRSARSRMTLCFSGGSGSGSGSEDGTRDVVNVMHSHVQAQSTRRAYFALQEKSEESEDSPDIVIDDEEML